MRVCAGDIIAIPECIGVGEIALSDHRGSHAGQLALTKIVAEARVAGILTAKAGVTYVHVGPSESMLQPLRDVVRDSFIPITQLIPTHCNRSQKLIDEAVQWCQDGGWADFTACSVNTPAAIVDAEEHGVLDRVCISSDAYGSLPVFNKGKLVRYAVGDCHGLLKCVKTLYFNKGWPLEKTLPIITSTPAAMMKLPNSKGTLTIGGHADIIALEAHTLDIQTVFCRGRLMKSPSYTDGGFFGGTDDQTQLS